MGHRKKEYANPFRKHLLQVKPFPSLYGALCSPMKCIDLFTKGYALVQQSLLY